MKNKCYLLLFGYFVVYNSSLNAQTTIYENDFNLGVASGWSLNASGTGDNQWVVNAEYLGFPGLVDNTPVQPGVIASSPNSSYLHIHNTSICSILDVCNASFDTGTASNRSAESPVINTSSFSGVTASFYYLCAGSSGSAYGVVEYSTNGGSSWTQSGAQISGISVWTQATISDAALSGAASLKIRFRWVNGSSGLDPAFAIDDFKVTGTPISVVNAIETIDNVSPTSWCFTESQNLTVNFDAVGTYNAGNLFNVQISNASGSFSSPTTIGTLNSSASGLQSVTAYPGGSLAAGNGYQIRVVSTNPVTIGSATVSPITINSLPVVTLDPLNFVCINSPIFALSGGSPAGGGYAGPGISNNQLNPVIAGLGTHTIIYSYTDANDCSSLATQPILVASCADVSDISVDELIQVYPQPTNDEVYLKTDLVFEHLELIDVNGNVVLRLNPNDKKFSLAPLNAGTYFLKLETKDFSVCKKVIKL